VLLFCCTERAASAPVRPCSSVFLPTPAAERSRPAPAINPPSAVLCDIVYRRSSRKRRAPLAFPQGLSSRRRQKFVPDSTPTHGVHCTPQSLHAAPNAAPVARLRWPHPVSEERSPLPAVSTPAVNSSTHGPAHHGPLAPSLRVLSPPTASPWSAALPAHSTFTAARGRTSHVTTSRTNPTDTGRRHATSPWPPP
jgi:hypothetical protein